MVRKIGITAAIIVLIVTVLSLFNQIKSALNVTEEINQAAEDLHQAEIKNRDLKKKLTEIKSPQFVEEVARDKLGLAKPGETLVIIPDEKIKQVLGASASAEPRLANWLGWLKVFWH